MKHPVFLSFIVVALFSDGVMVKPQYYTNPWSMENFHWKWSVDVSKFHDFHRISGVAVDAIYQNTLLQIQAENAKNNLLRGSANSNWQIAFRRDWWFGISDCTRNEYCGYGAECDWSDSANEVLCRCKTGFRGTSRIGKEATCTRSWILVFPISV